MALANYSDLQASAGDWLNRADLTAVIPDFITMATAALTRRLLMDGPVRQMLGTWSPSVSSELTALPNDFMGLKSWSFASLSDSGQIEFCEPEKIAEQKSMRPNQDGDPQLLSIVGNNLQVWPWNGLGPYAVTATYWQAIPALSNSNTTNWLLTLYPDAYLYTTLLQSAPYLKDDNRIQTWGTLATQIAADIVAADKIARFAPSLSAPILQYTPP